MALGKTFLPTLSNTPGFARSCQPPVEPLTRFYARTGPNTYRLVQLLRVVSSRMIQVQALKDDGSLDLRSPPLVVDAYETVAKNQLAGVLAAIASDPAGKIETAWDSEER